MRKIAFVFIAMFFALLARAQTGTISLSVTATPSAITVNQNCNYVVIEENSASPSNSYTITPAGQSTGIVYPAGARFVFSAGANGFKSGQTIGTISVSGGTVAFVGIESTATPTVPSSASNGGGNGNVGGSSGQVQYNNSGTFGGIGGSSVTGATGAVTLTAGLDTTTPLAIASHSNTQSATEFDVSNQSNASRDTPIVFRGRGFGSFTPASNTALVHFNQESLATSAFGWVLSNHAADVSKGALYPLMEASIGDGGNASLCAGGAVADSNNIYTCLGWSNTESITASAANPASVGGAGTVPFTIEGSNGQTADLLDVITYLGANLAKIDKSGNIITTGISDGLLSTVVTTGTSANLCTNLAQITFNQEGTAGQAVAYTLCTAGAGKRQCVMNSNGGAANTGILTVNASAAGQFIIFTDGTLTASGGNVTSGGAAGDAACFYGVDATHWQMTVQQGSWTKH